MGSGSLCAVEQLGAYDGSTYSNTLALERCFGWRGLLIEANAKNYAKLAQTSRTAAMVHAGVCAARSLHCARRGGCEGSKSIFKRDFNAA